MDDVQTVAWIVQYVDPHMGDRATPRRVVALHNAVGDYRDLDPEATSTELVLRSDYASLAKRVRELEADAGKWQRYSSSGIKASHVCRKCGHAYSPANDESEDCPACGHDGSPIDAAAMQDGAQDSQGV